MLCTIKLHLCTLFCIAQTRITVLLMRVSTAIKLFYAKHIHTIGASVLLRRFTNGEKLNLYHNSKVVARGDAVEGVEIHGRPMSLSFQKVAITDVIDSYVKLIVTSTLF